MGSASYVAFRGFDPTFEFVSLSLGVHRPFDPTPPFTADAAVLLKVLRVQGALFRAGIPATVALALLAACGFTLVRALLRDREHARGDVRVIAGVSALLSIALIVAAALGSNHRSGIWVYATEVTRRGAPYISFFAVLMLVCVASRFGARSHYGITNTKSR